MNIRPLSAALQRKAEEELNEAPEKVKAQVDNLREWVSQQPHLHSVKPSDQWLVAFLRGCKYNTEKAQGKFDMHYKLKATIPEFYENRDPLDPGIQELLKLGFFLPLRKTMSEDSPRILLLRMGAFSQLGRPLSHLFKICLMVVEMLLLEDDNFTIAGEDIIVDFKDITLRLIWYWTPSLARKLGSCSEKALSIRLRSLHFLNGPFFLAPGIRLFKMLLVAKIRDRLNYHNKDCITLYDHVDKSVLPEEYGGTDGTLQELIDYWKTRLESHRDWFLQMSPRGQTNN